MTPVALRRIERMNYVLGAILIAAVTGLGDVEQAFGAAVGALLGAVNFSIIRRIVDRIRSAPPGEQGRPALIFVPKMLALMIAVGLAIYFLPLSPVMLAVGFSLFLVSIAIETVRFVVSGPTGGAPGAGDTTHG